MPPDIIKQKDGQLIEDYTNEWFRMTFSEQDNGDIDVYAEMRNLLSDFRTAIIANIGRELETQVEALPEYSGEILKSHAVDIIRSITGISPTR